MLRCLACCAALLLSASVLAQDAEYPVHTPDEVIALAKEHPNGIKVAVTFTIKSANFGKKSSAGHLFLDSMEDYRDTRSLNVNVFPHAVEKAGLKEGTALLGKSVTVHGMAKHERINCHGGCPHDSSANHYFQTQIFVRDNDEISVGSAKTE